jgi:hypothetical protein
MTAPGFGPAWASMAIHPASDYGDDAHGMSRAQNIRREEESALDVTLSVQDVRRLLGGDSDPELRERVEAEIARVTGRLYDARDWGT